MNSFHITLAMVAAMSAAATLSAGENEAVKPIQTLDANFGKAGNTKNAVDSLAFTPDGGILAAGCFNSPILLWKTDDWSLKGKLSHRWSMALAFSPDGKTLASGTQGGDFLLWDVDTNKALPLKHPKSNFPTFHSTAFSGDGKRLLTMTASKTRVWDLDTKDALREVSTHAALGSNRAALTPDGKILITYSNTGTAAIVDVDSGKELGKVDAGGSIYGLDLTADGKRLAVIGQPGSGDRVVTIVDVADPTKKTTWKFNYQGNKGLVRGFRLTPDGKRLAVAQGNDLKPGSVLLFEADTGKLLNVFVGGTDGIRSLDVDPRGRWLVAGNRDGTIAIWELPKS